jgi:hypothetical protein
LIAKLFEKAMLRMRVLRNAIAFERKNANSNCAASLEFARGFDFAAFVLES